jgi:hypothetical protein
LIVMQKRTFFAAVLAAGGAAAGGAWWWHDRDARTRPRYVLINRTEQHDFDLALRMSLKLAEDKAGIENALVILPGLPADRTVEQVAADLLSRYRVGERCNGRGLLYLYAVRENLMKVEVSYALEGAIPDVLARRLEEAAKTYMLSEVPQDFLSELIITTNLSGMGEGGESGAAARPGWLTDDFLSGGGGALTRGYGKSFAEYARAIKRLPPGDLDAFSADADMGETLQRYVLSLRTGIGDPRLPLLTEGSRIFRSVVPRNEAQQQRIAQFLQKSGPLRILDGDNLSLAVPKPGGSNLPVVLRRGTDRRWYVDEPKSWTYFHRFEDSVDFRVKFGDNPFLGRLRELGPPGVEQAIYGRHVATPVAPAYPFDLGGRVEQLQADAAARPLDASVHAALGDLYFFEMNWVTMATEWYEKARALAPDELGYRWRLVDLYLNASRAEKCLAELKFLTDRIPRDTSVRDWYAAYKKAYESVQ